MTAAVICCSLLAACESKTETASTNTDTTANGSMDNMMATTDTTANAGTMTGYDGEFVTKAAAGGMTEVKAGEMAVKMGSTKDIRDIGQMMITDHTKANNELKATAEKNGLTVPAALPADKQAKLDELNGKKGAEFDAAYLALMKVEHDEAIALFTDETTKGANADLKAFAEKTLPTLKMHKGHVESGKAHKN